MNDTYHLIALTLEDPEQIQRRTGALVQPFAEIWTLECLLIWPAMLCRILVVAMPLRASLKTRLTTTL